MMVISFSTQTQSVSKILIFYILFRKKETLCLKFRQIRMIPDFKSIF